MLSTTANKIIYDISGISAPIATGYEIPFRIFGKGDVYVTIALESGENIPQKTGWSLVIPSSDTGVCKVIFDSGYVFPESSSKLVIYREVEITQTTDLRNSDEMDADILEEMADKLTAIAQQFRETLSRSFKLPISEEPEDIVFPGAEERAKKIIGFDETGNQVVLYENLDGAVARAENAAAVSEKAAETAADAQEHLDEMLAMRRAYYTTIGDGTTKTFIIRHGLNTKHFIPCIWCSSTELPSYYTMKKIDLNTIEITFEEAPPADSVTVVLSGVDKAYLAKMKWDDIEDVQLTGEQIDPASIMYEDDIYSAFGVSSNKDSRLLVRRRR